MSDTSRSAEPAPAHRITRGGAVVVGLAGMVIAASAAAGPFTVSSWTSRTDGSYVEDYAIQYTWGTTDWIDALDDGVPAFYHIVVSSGPGAVIDGIPYAYCVTIDYASYDIGFFVNFSGPGLHTLSLADIDTGNGPAGISAAIVRDANGDSIGQTQILNGTSLAFDTTAQAILNGGELVRIYFNPVPGPGALIVLLGGAPWCLGRRRRRTPG
ncbi:MAG: hypothetical protein KF817_00695 [Phycisphaeraceae bacterium]|nr:hypothetical protein [Phycisphaeraceae bacterium]